MYSKRIKRVISKSKPYKKVNSLVRINEAQWEESSIEESVSTDNEPVPNNDKTQFNQLTEMMCSLTKNVCEMSKNMHTGRSVKVGSEVIAEFCPEKENQCILRWLDKIEELKSIYGWNDLTTTYYTTNRLRGLAKTWYDSLPTANFTWEELKLKLINAFPTQLDYADQLNQMLKRSKRSNETMLEYFYAKVALLNQCKIHGKDAVSCIISGIPDKNLQTVSRVAEYKEPNELIKFLKTIPEHTNFIVPSNRFDRNSNVQRTSKEKKTDYVSLANPRRRQCYGCGSREHLLPECNKRQVKSCDKCGRKHYGECQSKDTSKKIFKLDSNVAAGKKYFMDVDINNKTVEAFIDLGANCSIIKDSIRKDLDLEYFDKKVTITGYGANTMTSLGKTNKVKVKVDQSEAEIDFVIIKDDVQDIPVLIGQDYTEQAHIKVIKDSNNLHIIENYLDILPYVIDEPLIKVPLWVRESYIIHPKHVMNVICELEFEGEVKLEESIRTEENNEYIIPGCVVNVINGETVIPVINTTNRDVQINKRKIFARGQPYVDEENCISYINNEKPNIEEVKWQIGNELLLEEQNQLKDLLEKYKSCFTSSLKKYWML